MKDIPKEIEREFGSLQCRLYVLTLKAGEALHYAFEDHPDFSTMQHAMEIKQSLYRAHADMHYDDVATSDQIMNAIALLDIAKDRIKAATWREERE